MDPSDSSVIGPSKSDGLSPIHSKKRKTATHDRNEENTRSDGVSAQANLLEPKTQDANSSSSTDVSSHYAISNLGERTGLSEVPATQSHSDVLSIRTANVARGEDVGHQGSSDNPEDDRSSNISQGHQSSNDEQEDSEIQGEESEDVKGAGSKECDPKTMKEYSAESRTYHAYFDEVDTPPYSHCSSLDTAANQY